MDYSKTHERTINLGKQLVEALERDHHSMPVTHWMAHYIAELMIKADTTAGKERETAQKKSFEAILMLWKHRSSLPRGTRPFEAFEDVMATLERLNPENRSSWMANLRNTPESSNTGTKKILHVIESLDKSARIILSAMLDEVASSCMDKATQVYLQNAKNELRGNDIEVLSRLFERMQPSSAEELVQARHKRIQDQLEHLDRFLSAAKIVRKLLMAKVQEEVPES